MLELGVFIFCVSVSILLLAVASVIVKAIFFDD